MEPNISSHDIDSFRDLIFSGERQLLDVVHFGHISGLLDITKLAHRIQEHICLGVIAISDAAFEVVVALLDGLLDPFEGRLVWWAR